MSEPQINNCFNCFNTYFSNVCRNCTVADEKSKILDWLSPPKPETQHQGIRTRRVEEVGDWLLQTREYRNWFGGIRGVNLVVQPCFATGIRGLARPSLGKRDGAREMKGIVANKLWH